MTVKNLIEKYRLSLFVKDGAEMVRFGRKPSAKVLAELKSRKEEIIQELKNQIAERQAAAEKKRSDYIANSDLRRCLTVSCDENLNVTRRIETLIFVERDGEVRAFRPSYGLEDVRFLEHETSSMARIVAERGRTPYGFSGNAFEISEEEEFLLLGEQDAAAVEAEEAARKAAEEAAKKTAEETAKRAAETAAKFAEAKETGNPVELDRWIEPCSEEDISCDLDIVVRLAMPDGMMKIKRIHTY